MAIYRGYNTVGNITPKTRLEDIDLIKQDLINHFNIRRGEKLMRPGFGTIIWDSLFEPLTDDLRDAIVEDINQIVNYDPRCEAESVLVDDYEHGIIVEARIRIRNTNQTEVLRLQFDQQSSQTLSI